MISINKDNWDKTFIDTDSVIIKSKKDLKEKLQKGLDDIKANRIYSIEEALSKIDNM